MAQAAKDCAIKLLLEEKKASYTSIIQALNTKLANARPTACLGLL